MLRKPTSVAALAALSLCLLAALPQPAPASFPGRPGMIVFNLTDRGAGTGGLFAIQPWDDQPRPLTWNRSDREPRFAPSGKRFVFRRFDAERPGLYVFDMRSGRAKALGIRGTTGGHAFGRRGMIVFARQRGNARDLFLRAADGEVRRLTSTENADEAWPLFTPNGKRIVFIRTVGRFAQPLGQPADGPSRKIYSMRVDGSDQRALGPGDRAYHPDISPNGEWLAYESPGLGTALKLGANVWQQSLRSNAQRPAFDRAAYPAYSPGGGKIALSDLQGIWLAAANGRGPKALMYGSVDEPSHREPWPTDLAWQPLPRK